MDVNISILLQIYTIYIGYFIINKLYKCKHKY